MIPGTFKLILEPLPAPCVALCQLIQVHLPLHCTHGYYRLGNIMDLLSIWKSGIIGIVPIIQYSPSDRDTERGIAFMRPLRVLLTGMPDGDADHTAEISRRVWEDLKKRLG